MAEQHNATTDSNIGNEETNAVPTTVDTESTPELAETEQQELDFVGKGVDFASLDKKDFVDLAEKLLESIQNPQVSNADIKNIDNVLKEMRPVFDEIKVQEKTDALKAYIAENGSEEGFEFKNDNYSVRFESLLVQIREARTSHYQKMERLKENNFETKTRLLQELREIVDKEEQGGSKETWAAFKQLQEAWKLAGNVSSPHNGSLWQAYNALVDRYFSIRNIQNELKDLDRKKNLEGKKELVERIEAIAKEAEASDSLAPGAFKLANDLQAEYKQIGPAPREEQEQLWARLKAAFDIIYAKRRNQLAENNKLQDEILEAKQRLLENIRGYVAFSSQSINEWNAKTKEVLEIQEQWNAIKGSVDKEKGKTVSKEFWKLLKTFFKNKGDFFHALEAERIENLKAKTYLCEQVEALLEAEDVSADNTNKVVELQKTWRTIGHVPEKQKDSIYNRFKKACDAFFDLKRAASSEVDKEYAENLASKEALIGEIKASIATESMDMAQLADFKKRYNSIGFVPRKDMQRIQTEFIDAINSYVKSASNIEGAEKDKLMLQNEVEVVLKTSGKGGNKSFAKQENDLRKKIKGIEDDVALWRNNIEFFGPSKGADKLKAEYDKKIEAAEKELAQLEEKLKLIVSAS